MSEQEQEQTPEQTPFVAPNGTDIEGDEPITEEQVRDAENGDDDAQDGASTPAPEPEPEPQGMTEKELEANHKKLDRARTTFFNRVSEIMGEDAQQLVECPACAHFVPGLIFPLEFSDDQKVALWHYMGLPDPNEIADAPDRHVCTTCKGRGQLRSGSLVPEYAIVNCRACAGRGYTDDVLPIEAANGANGAALPLSDTTAPPMPEDPAWIEAARAAGYTVVPPFANTSP